VTNGLGRLVASHAPLPVTGILRQARTYAWLADDELRTAAEGSWRRRTGSSGLTAAEGAAPARGHVLVIDAAVPDVTRDAGSAFILAIMRLLRDEGHAVTFLAHDGRYPPSVVDGLADLGIGIDDGAVGIRRWLVAHGDGIDRAIVARPDVAARHVHRLRRWSSARVVYYTHDLHFLRESRRADATGSPQARVLASRFRQVEAAVLRSVDGVLTPSSAEVPYVEALAPGREVHVVVPAIDLSRTGDASGPALGERRDVLFLGSFTHEPNVDAAGILVREVMPRVWERAPDTTVVLVGQHPPSSVTALGGPRVEVAGHVPDLDPYWARSRVMVAPLRYGAGVKGKILASLAAGVPVVTSGVGNEGIDLVDGRQALIAETPPVMAEHVLRVLSDAGLARELAREGRRHLAERFSEVAMRRQLLGALGY
jgi:glycosyltransferase involved in cell wall biosynthesis